jgi:hypothetical protein
VFLRNVNGLKESADEKSPKPKMCLKRFRIFFVDHCNHLLLHLLLDFYHPLTTGVVFI